METYSQAIRRRIVENPAIVLRGQIMPQVVFTRNKRNEVIPKQYDSTEVFRSSVVAETILQAGAELAAKDRPEHRLPPGQGVRGDKWYPRLRGFRELRAEHPHVLWLYAPIIGTITVNSDVEPVEATPGDLIVVHDVPHDLALRGPHRAPKGQYSSYMLSGVGLGTTQLQTAVRPQPMMARRPK